MTVEPRSRAAVPALRHSRLSPRRLRFAHEYILDLNATQAAIRAGYSPHTARQQGSRLLSFVDVSQEIARLQQAKSDRLGLTVGHILEGLRENAESARATGQISASIRALELIGRSMGMFSNRRDTRVPPVTFTMNVGKISAGRKD